MIDMTYVFINGSKESFEQNNMIEVQKRDFKTILDIISDGKFEGIIFVIKIDSRENNILNARSLSTTVNTSTEECLICFKKIQEMIYKLLKDIENSYKV